MPYIGQRPTKGDENNFKILDDISSYTLTFDGSDSSVVSDANDTITSTNHRFVQGQRVTYNNGGGSNIGGLTDGTVYFIIKEDRNTIKLSEESNGTAINITGVGGGSSHTLNVAFDGVNTKFKATHTNGQKARITRSAQLVISINGVIQQPHDTATPSTGFGFDLDGTIVFSQAPVSTDEYWAHVLTNNNVTFDLSDNTVDNFTGDGSTTDFNLSKVPPNNQNVLVTIDGVLQYPDSASTIRAYTIAANVLKFTTAPANYTEIQVRHIGFAGASTAAVTGFYGRSGNAILKSTDNISVGNASMSKAILTGTTTSDRNAGISTATGTIIYNTTSNILQVYTGNIWKSIRTGLSADFNISYLVVGGGGAGGGFYRGGGGGAGALRTNWNNESQGGGQSSGSAKTITPGIAYSILVGAGGSGVYNTTGNDGGQSVFDDIVSKGGGGGGRYHTNDGTEDGRASADPGGGSGGGGGGAQNTDNNGQGGASGTYGYDGGDGSPGSGTQCGGGGGGAAAAGNAGGGGGTDGDGGAALANTISGSSVDYAGGAGGGNYGGGNTTIGGGAGAPAGSRGSVNAPGLDASIANRGSGGGGAGGANVSGGAGSSGVVILRFSSLYSASFSNGVTHSSVTNGSETIVTVTETTDSSQTVTFI